MARPTTTRDDARTDVIGPGVFRFEVGRSGEAGADDGRAAPRAGPRRAAPSPYGSRPNHMAESPAPATTSTRATAANANVTSWVSWV